MDMSGMDMSGGAGDDTWYAKVYWMFVGSVIGIATLVNVMEKLIYRQRLASAAKSELDPARPKNVFLRIWATITAITREAFYAAPPVLLPKYLHAALPTYGAVLLVAANITLLLCLAFYGLNPNDMFSWEFVAFRCGWITLTQLPLVFLLAGKRNIIGFLVGSSYERLHWIHRWVARCLFLTATIHLFFWFRDWARYDFIRTRLEIDIISRTGLIAWCVLLWIVLSSFAPIRNLQYELFVIQHFFSYVAFVAMVVLHLPPQDRKFVWAAVGLYLIDRTVRTAYLLYTNVALFHRQRGRELFSCKATFEALPEQATHITIHNPPFTWSPGQHVFLSCHSIVPLQSHPFTIHSLPSDGHCSFIVRAHKGGTHRLFHHAKRCLPPADSSSKMVIIDGPYGRLRPLEQFDTVILIAGSTGATFTMPLLRDLVQRKRLATNGSEGCLVTRKVHFVWVVKNRGQFEWFSKQLAETCHALSNTQKQEDQPLLRLEVSIYITCDANFAAEYLADPTANRAVSTAVSSTVPTTTGQKNGGAMTSEKSATEQSQSFFCEGDSCCCDGGLAEDEEAISASDEPGKEKKDKKICVCEEEPSLPLSSSVPAETRPPPAHSPPPSFSSSDRIKTSFSDDNDKRGGSAVQLRKQTSHPPSGQASLALYEYTNILTGRPAIKPLINRELEKARGETAVVVCGPKGLVGAVREKAVKLSDERAVHKGTGAQGVYLHTECFGW